MKKIITALTLGALIGTAAFADVEVSLNFRQRANLFTKSAGASHKKDTGYTGTLFTDAYSGNGTDNLNFNLSGDIAAFESQFVSDEASTNWIRAKKLAASLFLGNLTLTAGTWSDGLVNGAYRTKADVDAGNLEGMDFEFKKLGSAFAASPSFFVDNKVNHVNNGGENYAAGLTYNQKLSAGNLQFNAFYISNEKSDSKNNADTIGKGTTPVTTTGKVADPGANSEGSWMGHALSFLIDARHDDIGQAEAVFKVGQSKIKVDGNLATAMAFGLYVQPKIINPLILTVGGAGSVVDGKFTDWSADLRVRYSAIPNKLSFTSFHSFSALTSDGEGVVANKTTKGIANYGKSNDGKMGGTQIERDKVLTNNIMVRYKVNDTLSLIGIAADMIGFGKNNGKDVYKKDADGKATTDEAGAIVQLRFSGWAQFFAANNAAISVGVVCAIHDVTDWEQDGKKGSGTYWTWGVPVIMRVKF